MQILTVENQGIAYNSGLHERIIQVITICFLLRDVRDTGTNNRKCGNYTNNTRSSDLDICTIVFGRFHFRYDKQLDT